MTPGSHLASETNSPYVSSVADTSAARRLRRPPPAKRRPAISGYDDVPDWAPRTPPENSGPYPIGPPRIGPHPISPHRGAARPDAAPPARHGDPAAGRPFDAFERPDRPPRRPGPAHAAAKRGRKDARRAPRPPRRIGGILLGPLAGAVALVLLTGAGAYALTSAADGCSGDDALTIDVAAAPGVAPAVTRAAERFNEDGNRIGGRCAHARVRATDPAAVATLLSGKGVAGVTEKPDVWIPDSSLWTRLVEGSGRSGAASEPTHLGSMATSPIVLAMPGDLATQLRDLGAPAQPSWKDLLAAAGTAGGAEQEGAAATGDNPIPARLFRLQLPAPDRTATGMGTLMLVQALLADDPQGQARFAGAARTFREGVAPSVEAQFAAFGREAGERYPVALAPEQAVFAHNADDPAQAAAAVYPVEGTVYLDHPVTVLSGEPAELDAARLLHAELSSGATRGDVQRLGFRIPDGTAPPAFSAESGLSIAAPKAVPPAPAAEVKRTMQRWAELTLGIRMLSIVDISGSMNESIAPGVTRLQSTIRTAQNGLSLLPGDTEAGQWVFSTELDGERDWRELVSVGPLDERLGSATRRQLLLSTFTRTKVKKNGDTGLYDTVIAAFDHMKRTHKPEYMNSVLLWTDGRNDDEDGPSLSATLDHILRGYDPERPVTINMLGLGDGVDVEALRKIARATNGDAYVAQTPGEVQEIFLKALSQEVCEPDC